MMTLKFMLAVAIIVVILTCRIFRKRCTCKDENTFIRDLPRATAVLKSSTLLSRAPPNQRLAEVFLISNAFTTTDPVFYKTFLAAAKSLLKTSDESLSVLAIETLALAQESSSSIPINKPTPLSPLIQVLCFRFAVLKFFPTTHLSASSTPSILRITKLINSLWISSKCPCFREPPQISMKNSLHRELNLLFPPSLNRQYHNPLNILLPAYETLWRVVLRCFLEVSFRRPSDITAEWREAFVQFRANATSEQFRERKGRCSVQDLVFESLRLYPPTKRIYRQHCEGGAVVAVDVEYLQRTEEIWGVYGNEFRPCSWRDLERGDKTMYKEAWMPFGKGGFQCPALKVAPMMIGVLVGCLVDTLGGVKWVLEDEGDKGRILRGGPLDNGRGAFGGLLLRRVKTD